MKGFPLSFFVFSPLCLFVAFSLNITLLFLSCPGSRDCLTKYFMLQSTPYLPTVSYWLSRNKGFVLRRRGGGREGRIAGFSIVFIFEFLPGTKRTDREPRPVQEGRRAFYSPEIAAGRLFIYLSAAHLFICRALSSMISTTCFLAVLSSYFVQKGKVQSGSGSRGRSLLNTHPPAPACADLDRGTINGSVANPHVCFVRPGREGSGLT